jgi:hypothetical protein
MEDNDKDKAKETIDSIELKALLGVSGQQLKFYTWLPERIGRGPRRLIIWNRQAVMEAIENKYGKHEEHQEPEKRVYVIQPSRFYDAMKDLVAATEKGFINKNVNWQYSKYKIVQNRGDIVLACQLKQNALRPWIYEMRREEVKSPWRIK